MLALGGYGRSTAGDVAQPDSALTAIALGFSLLPALLILVSLVWLPRYSLDAEEVGPMTDAARPAAGLQAADLPVHGGRTLAYVYDSGLPDVDRIGREAVAAYAGSNGLDPTAFPSLLAMENDLVGFARDLLDAPPTRGRHRDLRRHRVDPAGRAGRARQPARTSSGRRWCCPSTAHAAFHKAAHYFGVEPVRRAGRPDFRADAGRDDGGDRRPHGAGGRVARRRTRTA